MIKATVQFSLSAIATMIALSLVGCENKQLTGTAVGAGAGAAVGSLFGGGSGRIVATGVGGVVGAVVGNQVGASMDRADRAAAYQEPPPRYYSNSDYYYSQPYGSYNEPYSHRHPQGYQGYSSSYYPETFYY